MADSIHENLESLISGCVQRDQRAQEKLFKKYFGYALSVALLYNNDRNIAIEVVNDSFIKVFSKIRRFDRKMSFKAWLRKIVINTSLDNLRKVKREWGLASTGSESPHAFPAEASAILNAQDIRSLLNFLPYIYKTVFSLYEIEGYSHKEISNVLKIPESSSRTYLARAKQQLRELYTLYNK